MKPLTAILLLLLFNIQTIFAKEFYRGSTHSKCKTIKDTLTQTAVYISADVLPENEGGEEYLTQKLTEIILDSIPNNYDGRFTVAFIVDTSGSVYGERMIKAPIPKTGFGILKLVKSLHWKPATCNGKKVTMLYVRTINIDVTEN